MASKPELDVLDGVWAHLERVPEDALAEPRVRISVVLAEADELLGILQQTWVRQRLAATGLTSERMDLLGPARVALQEAQRRWLGAFASEKEEAEALQFGQDLRDELLSACHWNLRGKDVTGSLARISDSTDPMELGLDLRELIELVREHSSSFGGDRTFRFEETLGRADVVAKRLASMGERPVGHETAEIRQRAFAFLSQLMDELRQAGKHAFRGTREARSLFSSDLQLRRRTRAAHSSIRATAG
ncbi:MAG TPA: hypothetical protein VHM70_24865 [Polyangiaceae bacterium]|jgi:hypothetical protein|nr:hypothetical protein [Polyangiaceae bacterium]